MYGNFKLNLTRQLEEMRAGGSYKDERVLLTPQGAMIRVADGRSMLNLCANNYLGLAQHPQVAAAARQALDQWGYGLASVRFICGTQEVHRQLEFKLSEFLGTEDTILYSSCFDANGGLFEVLLGPEDAVISDELNHASIIDGIRLCKAQRHRYANNDMGQLAARLEEASAARFRMIATDGVFSMDGSLANLPDICSLAERHQALVMVDDSHAVGLMGRHGRGTHEHHGVMGRVDMITGTLGKALGGASGGYVSGRREIIEMLRQRSRPYLFSNTLSPVIAGASLKVLEMLGESTALRDRLESNAKFFRAEMTKLGFAIEPGIHPIVPIMIGDSKLAAKVAEAMFSRGIYVVAFRYPVVPQGKARIRCQISAQHTEAELRMAVAVFGEVRAAMPELQKAAN